MKFLAVVCCIVVAINVHAQERIVFEGGGAKGWSMFPHMDTDSIFCAPVGNVLRIAKGKTMARGWFWLTIPPFNEANDYRIETRVRQINGDIFNGFGVAYGYLDPENYVCFMISSWKQAKLASSENGRWYDWRDMLQVKAIKSMGEWNTLVLEKKGQEVNFKINDTLIISAPAPKAFGKGLGFLAHAPLAFEVEYLRLTEAPAGALKSALAHVSTETLPNATIRFHNILFDPGKIKVRPSSFRELNEVLGFLTSNTSLSVEIGGHTDNIGSDSVNQALSEARAKAVMGYLVDKGIPPQRLTAKGYGESQPIASNNSDSGRKKNRRVEFKLSTEAKN